VHGVTTSPGQTAKAAARSQLALVGKDRMFEEVGRPVSKVRKRRIFTVLMYRGEGPLTTRPRSLQP